MHSLATMDYVVFFFYFIVVSMYGYWIYNKKRKAVTDTNDYFLAEGSLTWWAIGASLIASNISAEQFIAMSGNGFKMGLAIASYEWMAAVTLLIVAIFFMPIYLKNRIFTMPQFLERRYDGRVSLIMAIFWLGLYVIINLTSILYLGALAVHTISGIDFTLCMVGLAFFALLITLGGMKVIGYTDVIQVFFLIIGGLATTYLALNIVASKFGAEGAMAGLSQLMKQAPDHFDMIFDHSNPNFISLPGLTILLGGMWIANLNYWGCNQYITQRALGADLKTARSGLLFAAFIKLMMPIIVVLPGIAAYVIHQNGGLQTEMMKDGVVSQDNAYPVLMNLLAPGFKGLAFAALTAAIVASLAGKANSIATIFTLDIYKKYIKSEASEASLVRTGRVVILAAIILGCIISPFLGIDKKGGFEFIQEYTGFVSPGIFAMFAMGFFWRRTTANAALFATIGGFAFSIFMKFLPTFSDLSGLASSGFAAKSEAGVWEIPFLDRMGFAFLFCVAGMVLISLMENKGRDDAKALDIDRSMFRPSTNFLIGAAIIFVALLVLYSKFW